VKIGTDPLFIYYETVHEVQTKCMTLTLNMPGVTFWQWTEAYA